MKSTPQNNPFLPVPPSVVIDKGLKNEKEVAKYLLEMIRYLELTGPFFVHVATKVTGSGFHHGVEWKDVKYNRVRLFVQTDDNGSRFLCYLKSAEMKPKSLYELLCSSTKLKGGRFTIDMARSTRPREARDANLVDVGEAISLSGAAEVGQPSLPKPKAVFGGVAEDPEKAAIVLTLIRTRVGIEGFNSESFHNLMRDEFAKDEISQKATGQLARRLCEAGYLTSEGTVGRKVYRFTEKGLRLIAEYDKSVVEAGAGVLNTKNFEELIPRLSELYAKAREYSEVAQTLAGLTEKISNTTKQIDELKSEYDKLVAFREELRAKALVAQKTLDDPVLASARQTYSAFQTALLGRKS